MDGYAATHTAVRELKESAALPIKICVRTSKYLSNLIEQDHRRVKQLVYPMLGFKKFDNAVVTISGIELAHKIRKKQFDTSAVASQWKIPSETTTNLMVAFHKNAKKMSKAEAWRKATLEMTKDPRYRLKPFYWAGFVVMGNGGM